MLLLVDQLEFEMDDYWEAADDSRFCNDSQDWCHPDPSVGPFIFHWGDVSNISLSLSCDVHVETLDERMK